MYWNGKENRWYRHTDFHEKYDPQYRNLNFDKWWSTCDVSERKIAEKVLKKYNGYNGKMLRGDAEGKQCLKRFMDYVRVDMLDRKKEMVKNVRDGQ